MERKVKSKLRITYIVFWLLLLYIVAALVWWFISLEKQNDNMLSYKLNQTEIKIRQTNDLAAYKAERHTAVDEHRRNRVKYAGEGLVFLGLILIGAFFLFRSLRRHILLQTQQQNFTMAVTHELKTPIAVAKLNLETLLKHQLTAEKQTKIVKMTLDETKRLDFLTNNILISSQLENKGYKLNKEELNLSGLTLDRVAEFRTRFPEKQLSASIDNDADVKGDPLLLQILINNLMENAIKYSEKDDEVGIEVRQQGQKVVLRVTDKGPGIPETEKKKIFSKFYRIGNEPTRKKQGTGLGLYLCKKIAKDHNADISVTDNHPQGSIFTVTFNS